jgi:ubiquinone/menaquinone biosynthesis C-methylase UbiE
MNLSYTEMGVLLNRALSDRLLTALLMRFADQQGISGILESVKKSALDEAYDIFEKEFGYVLGDNTRLRMAKTLIDFLRECGDIREEKGHYRWTGLRRLEIRLPVDELRSAEEVFSRKIAFLELCIEYASSFLRGGPPLYSFDKSAISIWEEFLGDAEFNCARSLLARLLLSGKSSNAVVLDLCCGPGFDILKIQEQSPEMKIIALDFTDIFKRRAVCSLSHPGMVQWVDSGLWNGFGSPLPFSDNSFDAVFFACADPYIPGELREFVYTDIFRVLKYGGTLGVLSHSYPDPAGELVKDPGIRRGILCHDFAESVCDGWHGFYDAAVSADLFRSAGYSVRTLKLNASVWLLDKL